MRFGVLPLFAFANAGVSLAGITLAHADERHPHGHRARAAGRQAGRHLRLLARRHRAAAGNQAGRLDWPQIFGVAILGGIGFTMSLFIGMLAFTDAERAAEIRIGVLLGSLASALAGYLVLRAVTRPAGRQLTHLSHRERSAGCAQRKSRVRDDRCSSCCLRGRNPSPAAHAAHRVDLSL